MTEIPQPETERGDDLPSVTLAPVDDTAAILRAIQTFVLQHPAAAKAAFAGLVAEGQAFAQTTEGARMHQTLARSDLLHRARLLLDLPGFSMLEPGDGAALPSTLADTLFMMAANSSDPQFLDNLFDWDRSDDA